MAQKATITITDHAGECTAYYYVRYKANGDANWTVMENQLTDTIVIENLADETTYDIEVTRICCNQGSSLAVADQFTTGATSPLS